MAIKVTIRPGSFEALDRAKASIRQVVIASILDLDADLRDRTPVDTGFAANSWQEQANGSPAPTEEGGRGGPDVATIAAGVGGVVSLVNSAVYIGRLNEGHSPQAPAGFVEAAANRLDDYVAKHVMEANARR